MPGLPIHRRRRPHKMLANRRHGIGVCMKARCSLQRGRRNGLRGGGGLLQPETWVRLHRETAYRFPVIRSDTGKPDAAVHRNACVVMPHRADDEGGDATEPGANGDPGSPDAETSAYYSSQPIFLRQSASPVSPTRGRAR